MNQLISNVLMQPNLERATMTMTDAVVERPQRKFSLIEKLERKKASLGHNGMPSQFWIGFGIDTAIDIVKQHQSWRKMPSDEKPQDMQICNLLMDNECKEYSIMYDVGIFRQYKIRRVWLSMTRPETYIDESKILAWQPINMPSDEFFESLQPPSEVQDAT